jgi:transcriptional regulator NrdR family protein
MFKEIWLCPSCQFEYEDIFDARNCCPPLRRFECPICGCSFEDKEETKKHFDEVCNNEEYQAKKHREDLEAAGQGILFKV